VLLFGEDCIVGLQAIFFEELVITLSLDVWSFISRGREESRLISGVEERYALKKGHNSAA
jgi:hypothetical protein